MTIVLEKVPVFRTFLLILSILSISIISLIPTSLEQVEELGLGENTAISVTHNNVTRMVSDHGSLDEYVNKITINNTKLVQQNNDLENNLQSVRDDDRFYAVVGIGASIGSFLLGYFLSKRHLESTIDKSIEKTVVKMAEVVNAQLRIMGFSDRGQVSINEKGDAIAKNERLIPESHVSVGADNIGIKVIKANEKKDDLSKGVKL